MATEIVTDTTLHQFHRTLVLNNKPSGSNTNQKTSLVLKTRDQTQYVYTIQTNTISQTNHLEHPVTRKKKNKTLHNGLALLKTMTNLTTHPADKPQYIRNNLEVFSPTYVINDIPSPNLPHQKGSNCLKKKKREWGRWVHQHEAPTPSGSIKN